MNNFIITIGGNIGCGKSTVIHKLEEHVCIKSNVYIEPEPIKEWGSWLGLFYNNPGKYGFGFQMKIIHSFFKYMQKHVNKTVITERSPSDSLHVFAKLMRDDSLLNDIEYDLFKDYVDDVSWKPNIYIYLRTDPEVCMRRITERLRDCESEVTLEYITKVHGYYEDIGRGIGLNENDIFVIDANQDKDVVLNEVLHIILQIVQV